jgi:hypothetical protein
MVTTQPDLITITQAAKDLGATRGMVHHHRLTGKLPTIHVDGVYLIPRASVEQLRRDRAARLGQSETVSR